MIDFLKLFGRFLMLDFQAQQHIGVDGAPLKKMVSLEHVTNVGPGFPDRQAVEQDTALLRQKEAGDQGKQRGFSTAAWPHNSQKMAGFQGKRNIGKSRSFALRLMVGEADMLQRKQRIHRQAS